MPTKTTANDERSSRASECLEKKRTPSAVHSQNLGRHAVDARGAFRPRRHFRQSGHQDLSYEFANLVEPAAAANPVACRRLADIAKAVAGDISPPRGRRISVATAMHELVLERLRCSGKPQAYTWSDEQQDCVDDVTQATRREVGDPDFDPWPSRRRMRARLQKKKIRKSGRDFERAEAASESTRT